jgi:DNA-3-methyladenine glycosylase II
MKLHSTHGELIPVPPFDFAKALQFLGAFTPAGGEQNISGLYLTKAIHLENQTFGFKLEGKGTFEEPVLSYTLFSKDKLKSQTKSELLDRISFFLSLEDDLKSFYATGEKDAVFAPIVKGFYGLHQVKFLTPFEAAAWSVSSQRISKKVAHVMKNRLVGLLGNNIKIDGADYLAFPSPNQVKDLDSEKLISVLKNERKAEYLMAVAEAFSQVNEEFLRKGNIDEVRNWLMDIRGIGVWSAHLILIRGLGRMEVLPENDEALFECAKEFYGQEVTKEELRKIGNKYREFKGYWAYYLRFFC